MFAAVLLFFCAGILLGAAAISGPASWVRVLLVVGGAVVLLAMCFLGWRAGRSLRVDLHWMIHGRPSASRAPRSRHDREAERLISSARPRPKSPLRVRFGRVASIPATPPWLVRGYALALVGPFGLLLLLLCDLVYVGLEHALRGADTSVLPLWALVPFQVVALTGGVAVLAQMPRPALGGTRLRLRSYAFVCVSAALAVLLERTAGQGAASGVVAAVSLVGLTAVDIGVGLARRAGDGRNR
jgi:hypothetical protein